MSPGQNIVPARKSDLERALARAEAGGTSVISQAIRRRIPIHFGGMSDPFQPAEIRSRVTLAYLDALSARSYPVIISTKGALAADREYVDALLQNPYTIVQVSLISLEDRQAGRVEPKATPPSMLLRLMEALSAAGIIVTCRLQPYHPEICGDIGRFVNAVAAAGARQVSIEHMKVPLERVQNDTIGAMRQEYLRHGARRDGREYILPLKFRRDAVLKMKEACNSQRLFFGAADNEFQYLSDSWACCSGADLFPGFENFYRYHIGYAIRRSIGAYIRLSCLDTEWRPFGSIDRYLNSRTRLSKRQDTIGTAEAHIRYRWNSNGGAGSPLSYDGVKDAGFRDEAGNRVYRWDESGPEEAGEREMSLS